MDLNKDLYFCFNNVDFPNANVTKSTYKYRVSENVRDLK